jgi:Histidine kinase
MNRLFVHNTFFRFISGIIFGILVYLLILLINNSVESLTDSFSNQELYVSIILSYIAFESMRVVIKILDRNIVNDNLKRRMITQVLGTLIVSLGLISLAIASYFHWVIGFSIAPRELNLFLITFGITGVLYNTLYFSHLYLQRENKFQLDHEAKLREKIEADFSSFKNEINPDLLYESLENLILTIHHNSDLAEEQIDYLAGIYRYSLVNRNKELISLEEEIAVGENLLRLLNFRFNNFLSIHCTIIDLNEVHLIPGSLLITIDHIVRNTLISAQSPLQIKIYLEEDDDYVVVEHTLNDKLILHDESRVAFSQLQRSYTFFSEKPFVQVKAGKENYIKFPLVRVQQIQEEIA